MKTSVLKSVMVGLWSMVLTVVPAVAGTASDSPKSANTTAVKRILVVGLPDNVEITTRTGDGIEARFIFNNTNKEQRFMLDGGEICLAPFEMKTDIKKR